MIAVDATWRVWVTEGDLREARAAWLRARDGGAPVDRVADLLEELERLTRTAVYQATGDPAGGAAVRPARAVRTVRRVPSPSSRRPLPARMTPTG